MIHLIDLDSKQSCHCNYEYSCIWTPNPRAVCFKPVAYVGPTSAPSKRMLSLTFKKADLSTRAFRHCCRNVLKTLIVIKSTVYMTCLYLSIYSPITLLFGWNLQSTGPSHRTSEQLKRCLAPSLGHGVGFHLIHVFPKKQVWNMCFLLSQKGLKTHSS